MYLAASIASASAWPTPLKQIVRKEANVRAQPVLVDQRTCRFDFDAVATCTGRDHYSIGLHHLVEVAGSNGRWRSLSSLPTTTSPGVASRLYFSIFASAKRRLAPGP